MKEVAAKGSAPQWRSYPPFYDHLAGHTVAFAEGEVADEKGDAVCRAVATYRVLRPSKPG